MAVIVDQVPGHCSYRIRAEPAAVHRGVEVDVDAGVAVVRVVLGRPLDPAHHPAVTLDDIGRRARLLQVLVHGGDQIVAPAPEVMNLRAAPDGRQCGDVVRRRRFQPDQRAAEYGHDGNPTTGSASAPGGVLPLSCQFPVYFQRKCTKTRPKLVESFSTR